MIKFFKRAERYIWILFGCGFIPILLYYFIFGDESSELDGFNIIGVLAFIGGGAGILYFIFKFLVKFLLFTGIMRLNEGEEIFGETAEQEELEEPEDEPLVSYTSYTELYDETERRTKLDDKRDTPDLIELYKEMEQKKLEDKRR